MERLTKRKGIYAHYPFCFREDTCGGLGVSEKCEKCDFPFKVCEKLASYEDTDFSPEQIREMKERDTAKAPDIRKNKSSDAYMCPNCNLIFICKDEAGWFCGQRYSFCPDCGQRLKWEE